MPEDRPTDPGHETLFARGVSYVEGLRADRERRAWVDVLLRVYERHREMGGSLLAGALGYRLFLLTLPLALVTASALGFALAADATSAADAADEAGLPGLVTEALGDASTSIRDSRWWTGVIGIFVLLWASLTLLRALRTVHALAWRLPIRRLSRTVPATLIFAVVVLSVWSLSAAANAEAIGLLPWRVLVDVGLMLVYGAFWVLLAAWLPHRSARLGDLVPGAVVFAVGVQVFRLFVVIWVAPRFDHGSAIYGVFGMTTALLLALYVFGSLIVLSAVVSATMWERRRERAETSAGQATPGDEPAA